jgi:hypothetical protein
MIWQWLINELPWYVQAIGILVIIGVPAYLVVRVIWGVEVANRVLLLIVGAAAVAGAASRLRQQGRDYERERVQDENEKVLDIADDARDEFKKELENDPGSIDVDDGHRRDD